MIDPDQKMYVVVSDYDYINTLKEYGPLGRILLSVKDVVNIINEDITVELCDNYNWNVIYAFLMEQFILDKDNVKLRGAIEKIEAIFREKVNNYDQQYQNALSELMNAQQTQSESSVSSPFSSSQCIIPSIVSYHSNHYIKETIPENSLKKRLENTNEKKSISPIKIYDQISMLNPNLGEIVDDDIDESLNDVDLS